MVFFFTKDVMSNSRGCKNVTKDGVFQDMFFHGPRFTWDNNYHDHIGMKSAV